MDGEIRKPRTWDELPPVVYAECEYFSTRILEYNYRAMQTALELTTMGLDAKQCRDLAKRTLEEL